jgi:hypothetical protein
MSILVDYSGIAIASIFSQVKNDKIEESFIRHLILNTLRMYNVKYRAKYGQMVLACDGGSWRKSYYPFYKASRRKGREESSLDWTEIFRILNKVKDEIAEHLPYKVIQVSQAEADDVIGTLVANTQEFGQYEPVMIISADKDFIQLQRYDNVQQFSPMTKKLLTDKNPHRYLFEHIVKGDSGDGVPNILSDDNVFITEGMRQTPVRATKIEDWYAAYKKSDVKTVLDDNTYRNYIRNRTLIDLEYTPSDIREIILDTYNKALVVGNSKVLNYLISNRCNMLIGCAEEFFIK